MNPKNRHGHRLRKVATYASKDRETAREFFDLEKRARELEPTQEELITVQRAAVAISAMGDGRSSVFPSAEEFLCDMLGIDPQDNASSSDIGFYNAQALKLCFKFYNSFQEQVEDGATIRVVLNCSECMHKTISAQMGVFLCMNSDGELVPSDAPSIVSLDIGCSCRKFSVDDYERLEERAVRAYNYKD